RDLGAGRRRWRRRRQYDLAGIDERRDACELRREVPQPHVQLVQLVLGVSVGGGPRRARIEDLVELALTLLDLGHLGQQRLLLLADLLLGLLALVLEVGLRE